MSPDGAQVYTTGVSAGSGTGDDYATAAYDAATGDELWTARYNGTANARDWASSVAASPDGTRVVVSGDSQRSGSFVDFATIAYDSGARPALAVPIDVRPRQCPNQLRLDSTDDLAVAITGTTTLDVRQIDPASVRLQGVAPRLPSFGDFAIPFMPMTGKTQPSHCSPPGTDGIGDLKLKVPTPPLVAALGPHANGDVIVLHLTGALKNGTTFVGEDVVVARVD